MRVPTTWLAELVDVPAGADGAQIAADLVKVGLEEEGLHGGDITGPLVVGRVLDKTDEPQKNGKTIHFCHVDVGPNGQQASDGVPQEIVCGAHNFEAGDWVVVVLPGAVLPGGFAISARKTYGHPSNGMIVSEAELGISEDHDGIIVLTRKFADDPELLARLEPGMDAIPLLGLDEQVVEVNVTPDRGYCFSMRGIAREYALATGQPGALRDPVAIQAPPATGDGYPVRLIDERPIDGVQGCDRYVARVVRGVDVHAASPSWMAKRLTQSGMRPISLIVDITNYLMLLTGQPLHAFDLDKLSGAIEVRRARPGEMITTLDEVERALDPEDLLITDDGHTPLVIAGVFGGAICEVDETTTNVLIEAAHFDPITIARSSRRHRLVTEASKRFERGVDPDMTAGVAELAVRMLVEYGRGTPDPAATDARPHGYVAPPPVEIAFRTAAAWEFIQPPASTGGAVPDGLEHDDVVRVLRDLGCKVEETDRDGGWVVVRPPSWRPDLRNGPDLIEEVARLRGYHLIPSVLPTAPGGRGLTNRQRFTGRVAAMLADAGLTEVLSYPFVSTEVFDRLGYDVDDPRRIAVRLANPLSDERPLLHTTVLSTLLDTLRLNVNRGFKDCGLYEIGLVYLPAGEPPTAPALGVDRRPDDDQLAQLQAGVPHQPRHVALALAGDASPAGPWGKAEPYDAHDAIALAVAVGRTLGLELTTSAAQLAPWHPGRCAALSLSDGTVVGHAGELHPKVAAALTLPARTCAAELDLDALIAAAGTPVRAAPLSTYPVATSDVALDVAADVPVAELAAALREGAGPLLESLTLFDVYEGEQVSAGRKSVAFRLALRADDRTLTTAEVSKARDAAVAVAVNRFGAVQRGAGGEA